MGFLEISENGHYFVKDGAPFFWLGDTLWPAPCAYSEEEIDFYFKRRKEQGFTVIHIMATWASFGGDLYAVKKGDSVNNMPMWLNNNPATPDPEYFKSVDMVVRLAAKYDLLLVILPCGGGGGTFVGYNKIITAENARAYARWLANRYKDEPHIIWANGFDLQPWLYEDIAQEFAAGIREGGAKQLMSYHASGGNSSSFFHNEAWLDMNFIQTWADYNSVSQMVTADYNRRPYKPVVHVEGAYEDGIEYGSPITSRIVRLQAYNSILAGGFHTYGHNDMWRKSPYWRDCIEAKGANELTILKNFFTSFEWWKLRPNVSLFGSEVWRGPAAAISEDGSFGICYCASRMEFTMHIDCVEGGGPLRAAWIDPATGKEISRFTVSGKVHSFISPACCDDALLVLKR